MDKLPFREETAPSPPSAEDSGRGGYSPILWEPAEPHPPPRQSSVCSARGSGDIPGSGPYTMLRYIYTHVYINTYL
jgi:hypothetical protein